MAVSTIGIIIVGIAALALLGWLWWQVPKWQLNSLKPKLSPDNPKERADVEDNFRKTLGHSPRRTSLISRMITVSGAGPVGCSHGECGSPDRMAIGSGERHSI
jgi:hypothetical protein